MDTNNPGNLTVNKPGQLLYPGQVGTYAANGFNYATFGSVQDGFNALTNYVSRHVASGWNTASKFAYGYLGTSTANAANPYPQNYAATLSKYFDPSDPSAIATGIATAEGNGKQVAGLTGGGAGLLEAAKGQLGNFKIGVANFAIGAGAVANDPHAAAGALVDSVATSAFGNAFKNYASRTALIVLGVILVAGALIILALQTKTVQTVVKATT